MDESSINPDRVLMEELQGKLTKSAEIGKHLLQECEMLREQMEAERNDYTAKIEEKMQENYNLRHKLEMQYKLHENVVQENESILEEQQKKSSLLLQRMEEQNAKQVKTLASEKADMVAHIEKLELEIHNKSEKITQQADYIEELSNKLDTCTDTTSDSQEDITQMVQYISDLEQKHKAVEMKMMDLETSVKIQSLEKESLESKIKVLEEDVEERTQQANEWYHSLQSVQEECQELKVEVANLKMKLDDDDRAESGNSLFAEVEDKRIAAERKLISLQTKYSSLEKAYQVAKQQINKHKTELMSLLCRYSGEVADAAYVRSLNIALAQSRNEVESLSIKLSKSEQQERQQMQQMKVYHDAFSSTNNKKAYLQFLENEIEQLKREKMSLAKELDKKRKQLIAESDNLQETKFQLRTSEQRCLKLTHDLSKCKQKTDEAEEKLRNEVALHKDLQLQIQFLEERLASRRAGRKSGRHSVIPASPVPTKSVKAKEQEIPETIPPVTLSVAKEKREDLQNAEETNSDKASILSAEEATDRFIAELKQDISMRRPSGVNRDTENIVTHKDPLTGTITHPERKPLSRHNLNGKLANKTLQVMDNKVNQCPQQ